jgi:hypothetical protein
MALLLVLSMHVVPQGNNGERAGRAEQRREQRTATTTTTTTTTVRSRRRLLYGVVPLLHQLRVRGGVVVQRAVGLRASGGERIASEWSGCEISRPTTSAEGPTTIMQNNQKHGGRQFARPQTTHSS